MENQELKEAPAVEPALKQAMDELSSLCVQFGLPPEPVAQLMLLAELRSLRYELASDRVDRRTVALS